MLFQMSAHSHGLIEKPMSRQYFCGKTTQPHHIEPNNKFHMNCTLPARSGHHVIYAEWGRNQSTNERFHSCIDVAY